MTPDRGTSRERQAADWITPYSQAEHLVRTREWVIKLDPHSSEQLRLAALTHDIERMFPGGPKADLAGGRWANPDYLFAHSTRSGDIVQRWLLEEASPAADEAFATEVRELIQLHELGGTREADVLQAADSLSWFETLATVAAQWIRDGESTPDAARAKLTWMYDRIRHEPARSIAAPLFADALEHVDLSLTQEVAP
jgi:hypothetical protein